MFLYILLSKPKCIHKGQNCVICQVRVPFDVEIAVFQCTATPTKPEYRNTDYSSLWEEEESQSAHTVFKTYRFEGKF